MSYEITEEFTSACEGIIRSAYYDLFGVRKYLTENGEVCNELDEYFICKTIIDVEKWSKTLHSTRTITKVKADITRTWSNFIIDYYFDFEISNLYCEHKDAIYKFSIHHYRKSDLSLKGEKEIMNDMLYVYGKYLINKYIGK